jgi:23S rRNA G2069 N7-methylase RlmK/C1962 C5-methylase RlmI
MNSGVSEFPESDEFDSPEPAESASPTEFAPYSGTPSAKTLEQATNFRHRLQNRARHLRRWPTKRGITCFRLYDRDVPDVPLVVDRYEHCLHMAEYERPHERSPEEHSAWLDLMVATAAETLEVAPGDVFLKRRERQRGKAQYERVAEAARFMKVQEGGLKFRVNLSDYLDTGLFLDHRITRGMVRDQAAGKRFLNLFCYTGAFTVYAAAGGAASSTSVDTSNTYLEWARDNLCINNLHADRHEFVRQDAVEFIMDHPLGNHYDLAIIDPPTFSNSKRSEENWDVERDHSSLLTKALHMMSLGGVIYFSTNSRRFHFAEESLAPLATIREISKQTVPEDFRNERIHRCWRLVKR